MLSPTKDPPARVQLRGTSIPPRWRPPASRSDRLRRIALMAAVVCLIPAGVSFVQAMTAPSNSGFGIRAVEWLRDHGARGIVNQVESIYYSLNSPATGGPSLHALPGQP